VKIIDENKTEELLLVTEILFDQLVSKCKWEDALKFANDHSLEDFSSDDKDKDKIRNHKWTKYNLHVQFIKRLSVSEELATESNRRLKNLISKYLYDLLLTNKREMFYSLLTLQQAGGALERANMIKDCLQFYENVISADWPSSESDILFAKQRWLKCKNRQIGIQSSDDIKRKTQKEIVEKMAAWGINSLDEILEYPVVNPSAKPSKTEESTDEENIDHTDLPTVAPYTDLQASEINIAGW
jgi:hypothetical protein